MNHCAHLDCSRFIFAEVIIYSTDAVEAITKVVLRKKRIICKEFELDANREFAVTTILAVRNAIAM